MTEKTNITMDVFYDKLMELLDKVETKETENIKKAGQICAESVGNDGVIHVFGSGHSYGFGMEISNRPGSLAAVHNISSSDFVIKGKYSLETFRDNVNYFERRPNIAGQLYDLYDIRPQDCFIIISNSGINGLVIDMALKAKEMNHKVIVVTSWEHTSAEASRHPSGKKLYQLGDVVIDNCGPRGDALIETDGPEKICSVSSITGAFIAQSIAIEAEAILKEEGKEIPVFYGNQTEADAKHDDVLRAHYKGRV
jgi:uncharacterized phosphosugar-binding protein